MYRRTVSTDSGFPKCSWAHVAISFTHWCRFLMQYLLRDRRSRSFNVAFRPCPLRGVISPDSLNLLTILRTEDGEIPSKFLAIARWEMFFLNCSIICARICSQSGDPHPILVCEWLSVFGENLFILNHGTRLFPNSLFTCGMFQTGVWWAFLSFLSLFCQLCQLFCNVLLPLNS